MKCETCNCRWPHVLNVAGENTLVSALNRYITGLREDFEKIPHCRETLGKIEREAFQVAADLGVSSKLALELRQWDQPETAVI